MTGHAYRIEAAVKEPACQLAMVFLVKGKFRATDNLKGFHMMFYIGLPLIRWGARSAAMASGLAGGKSGLPVLVIIRVRLENLDG